MLKLEQVQNSKRLEVVLRRRRPRFSHDLWKGVIIALCLHLGTLLIFRFKTMPRDDGTPTLPFSRVEVSLAESPSPSLAQGRWGHLPEPTLPPLPAIPNELPPFLVPLAECQERVEVCFDSIEKISYQPLP